MPLPRRCIGNSNNDPVRASHGNEATQTLSLCHAGSTHCIAHTLRLRLRTHVLHHRYNHHSTLPACLLLAKADKDTMDSSHTHNQQASTNYREAFQLFDKRGNGRVDRAALGDLLRACGQNPTLAEIADLERGVGADCT